METLPNLAPTASKSMKILRAVFESYNLTDGQFFNAVLFIKEEHFNMSTTYEIMQKQSHILCSEINVDQLIAVKKCGFFMEIQLKSFCL